MELTYLKTFREVAKTGSYTRAAETLGYAQSSVTTQIQKLEAAYGAVLLERYGRGMKLTLAGEALLQYADEIARLHEESREVVSKQSKGTLSVGTIETLAAFYLPPYLQAYRQHFPEINVMLQPANEPFIIESVKEGALDVGIILDPPYSDPELHTVVLREEELVIIAHPDHRISGMSEVRLEHLESESLILTEDGCTYRAMLQRLLKGGQVSYRLAYEFGNLEAIKQCVVYGLGIALLPRIAVAEAVRQGLVVAVPFIHPECRFYTQLIYAKRKWQSAAFKGFVTLLGETAGS
jgi:DNA-binding transcriptional LysR family regulator